MNKDRSNFMQQTVFKGFDVFMYEPNLGVELVKYGEKKKWAQPYRWKTKLVIESIPSFIKVIGQLPVC